MAAATVVYRNAEILVGGLSMSAQCNQLDVNYKAEMLDRSTFGDTTRNRRGGLFMADISAKGFAQFSSGGLEELLFGNVGLTDIPVAVFPDGITEGSQSARGFAMLAVMETFTVGGAIGTLLPFDAMFHSAGLG